MVSGKTVTISRIVTKFSVTKSRIHCIYTLDQWKKFTKLRMFTISSIDYLVNMNLVSGKEFTYISSTVDPRFSDTKFSDNP